MDERINSLLLLLRLAMPQEVSLTKIPMAVHHYGD